MITIILTIAAVWIISALLSCYLAGVHDRLEGIKSHPKDVVVASFMFGPMLLIIILALLLKLKSKSSIFDKIYEAGYNEKK